MRVIWLNMEPEDEEIEEAQLILEYLEEFNEEELQSNDNDIPEREWNLIKHYHNAMSFALETIIEADETGENACILAARTCPENWFDDLMEEAKDLRTADHVDWQCDHEFEYSYEGYTMVEQEASKYQLLEFAYNYDTKDIAFWLDGVAQQLSTFRPHYHEVFVHYTARYIEDIKRVIWIGGGDSMLLNEFLKYPSLELAVGLELDQKGKSQNQSLWLSFSGMIS